MQHTKNTEKDIEVIQDFIEEHLEVKNLEQAMIRRFNERDSPQELIKTCDILLERSKRLEPVSSLETLRATIYKSLALNRLGDIEREISLLQAAEKQLAGENIAALTLTPEYGYLVGKIGLNSGELDMQQRLEYLRTAQELLSEHRIKPDSANEGEYRWLIQL